jgi:F-type H+-transporting ATPase subunit c
MRKQLSVILLALSLIMLLAPVVLAEEAASGAAATAADAKLGYYGMVAVGCGVAIGFAALGTGIGMGHGLNGATMGIARNPGVSGKITTTMIIGFAMIESLAIYALVVILILLFMNPFKV